MVNINKLRGKIVECGLNVEILADCLEVSKSTLYRKFSGNGDALTVMEAKLIAKELKLSEVEIMTIFFADSVA